MNSAGLLRCLFALAMAGALLCGCQRTPPAEAAERARGKALLANYGCVACHSIKGLHAVAGAAGPPLEQVARNSYIAGVLPNTLEAMTQWIVAPRYISPGTAMPDLGVSPGDARAMAAYLYHQ